LFLERPGGCGDGLPEVGSIGTGEDEAVAEALIGGEVVTGGEEDSGVNAACLGGLGDADYGGFEFGMGELAGDAEVEGEVEGTEEENGCAINGGDLLYGFEGCAGFDLEDGEEVVGIVEIILESGAELGGAGDGGDAAHTVRRVAHGGDGGGGIGGGVDAGKHDAMGTGVKDAVDTLAGGGFDAYETGAAGGSEGLHLGESGGFADGAVFEVDEGEVESGAADDFGDEGGAEREEGAEKGFAGIEALAELAGVFMDGERHGGYCLGKRQILRALRPRRSSRSWGV
jgi:hypothetical protein